MTPLPDWWVAATPTGMRAANPGKHKIYVYGQQSADGVACIGCEWEKSAVIPVDSAISLHDRQMGLVHDHRIWVPIESGPRAGTCPCGRPEYDVSCG